MNSGWNLSAVIASVHGRALDLPDWPPDMFAVCATVLAESGCYVSATELGSGRSANSWHTLANEIAEQWRIGSGLVVTQVPDGVVALWSVVCAHANTPMDVLNEHHDLVLSLIRLMGIADSRCAGFGINGDSLEWREVLTLLATNKFRSLTRNVNPNRARVLPKQRTPQTGLALRSLSHHLALVRPRGVVVKWLTPIQIQGVKSEDILNILVCPWPIEVRAEHFGLVEQPYRHSMNRECVHRFFSFSPPDMSDVSALLNERLLAAKAQCGEIDLVVFPELALSDTDLSHVRATCLEHGVALLAGVRRQPGENNRPFRNTCCVDVSGLVLRHVQNRELRAQLARAMSGPVFQDKHHRWSMSREQIIQYQLGSRLPVSRQCWEWTAIQERRLNYWTFSNWLTWTSLICEDLARQDPVSEIVRSVAPNLLIALLMDGPQIKNRWPAKFATVFAEDPGSSVLTVSSLGMASRSIGPDGRGGSRVIALWNDCVYGVRELSLPEASDCGVLSVSPYMREEWSADGRSDHGVSSIPVFAGFAPV